MMDCLPDCLRIRGALLALLLAFHAVGSFAAGIPIPGLPAADAPAATAPKSTAPEPIAASEIPGRADEDERFAQTVVSRTRPQDTAAKMGAQLDDITKGIVNLSKTFEKEDLKQLSAIRLESLESHWKFYDGQLEDWRKGLDRASAPFIADAAELAKRRAVWDVTRASLATGGANSALIDRADVILGQIRLAEEALAGPMDEQFQLRRRANTVQASIDAGKKGVDAAINYYDRRLGMVDAVPVWQAWNDTQFSAQELQGASAGLRLETAFVNEWGKANGSRIRGYKIASVVLLPLLLFLAYRNRKVVPTEPEMQAAARVLSRPISAWLLLTLVGVMFFFPDAPLVMHQIALLLALIPVLRLLPQKVYDVLGPWPYVGTVLVPALPPELRAAWAAALLSALHPGRRLPVCRSDPVAAVRGQAPS